MVQSNYLPKVVTIESYAFTTHKVFIYLFNTSVSIPFLTSDFRLVSGNPILIKDSNIITMINSFLILNFIL